MNGHRVKQEPINLAFGHGPTGWEGPEGKENVVPVTGFDYAHVERNLRSEFQKYIPHLLERYPELQASPPAKSKRF